MADLNLTFRTLEQAMDGTLGIHTMPLRPHGKPITYRSNESFPAASTIKVFVLHALLERVAEGATSLAEEIPLHPDDQVTGSGVLKALTPNRLYTLHDLATLMIIISDNTATNLLIEYLGVEAVNNVCHARGWTSTELTGKLQKGGSRVSVTTPRDLSDYFSRLWRGELLPHELTRIAQRIYEQQQYTDQLGRDIGYDPYSTETGTSTLVIASKGGAIRGVRNDAGVIDTGEGRFALAIMTKDCPDERFHSENLGSRTVAAVSKALFDHFNQSATGDAP